MTNWTNDKVELEVKRMIVVGARVKSMALALLIALVCVAISVDKAEATVEGDQSLATEEQIREAIDRGIIKTVDDQNGSIASLAATRSIDPEVRGSVTSFSGATRIETAAMEALYAYSSSEWVVVVGSDGWPDALAASGLAGALCCPILYAEADSLPGATRDAISSLGASKALVIGSEARVSGSVVDDLGSMGLETERIAGSDRFATQVDIYEYGAAKGLWASDMLVVASGEVFADALSLSPVAFVEKAPVFLVGSDRFFTAEQQRSLIEGASAGLFSSAVVGGDEAVVSEAAQGYLAFICNLSSGSAPASVERVAGSDRYATSAAVAEWAVSKGILSWEGVAFASGEVPYDALAGSATQGVSRSVLLLASDASGAAAVVAPHSGEISGVRFMGSKAAVPMTCRMEICDELNYPYSYLAGLKVYVDAGHGGEDPGASGSGYQESALTSELANKVGSELREKYGVEVYVNDDGGDYRFRHPEAVALGCDLFISIHFNAGHGTGTESYIHSENASPRSHLLQSNVHPRLIEGVGLRDRGMMAARYAVTGGSLPAVLLEICFIDNSNDMAQYQVRKDIIAEKVADGIVQPS